MSSEAPTTNPMEAKPQREHDWLQRLVGEWSFEAEAGEPGKPPEKASGKQKNRSLGGLWLVGEGSGEMPGGGDATTLLTLGYDPRTQRYVGTWVGSMMAHMWVYDGWLDEARRVLTLEAEGPSFSGDGTLANYRDIIEMVDDDAYLLKSQVQTASGEWQQFMVARYRRTR